MERDQQLDLARVAGALILLVSVLPGFADEYADGFALARQGRWTEAEQKFLAGHKRSPRDERYPIELGGVAFRQKRYSDAARWLRKAAHLNPEHVYTNDFLGTVYFLQGNLDAALKYWNRARKPLIAKVRMPAELRVDPVLLDRAFTFAPGSVLMLHDLRDTRERVAALGIFASDDYRLEARSDGEFDVAFDAAERTGLASILSTLRGLPYAAVLPEYRNAGRRALNVTSMLRWDPHKRRVHAALDGPLRGNPAYQFKLGVDWRDEKWDLQRSGGVFPLRRTAVAGEVASYRSAAWFWSSAVEVSHRDYPALSGYQLKYTGHLRRDLLYRPEDRLRSSVQVTSDTGRLWSSSSRVFERLQLGVSTRWREREDYALESHVRAGRLFGPVPFDELFILGLERDNDLLMRAHIGTRAGRKGSAPVGRAYVVANQEIDKIVYRNGLVTVAVSPFLDTGAIGDHDLGSRKWLVDTGAQAKLRVLGVGFTVTFGKDLRTGKNAFYLSAQR